MLERGVERDACRLGPARCPHLAVAHVECEDERLAELEPWRRVGPGGGADDHAIGAGVEQRTRVVQGADAPRGLHGQPGLGRGAHELGPYPA